MDASVQSVRNSFGTGVRLNARNVPKTLEPVFGFIRKYAAPVTSWGSLITGLGSFLFANFKEQNDYLDLAATYFSKASLFATSVYGVLENAIKKNFLGTLGYSSDLVTSVFSSAKKMYFFRAIGSSLDQLPAMLEDFVCKYAHIIKEEYKDEKSKNSPFYNFSGFFDSFKKTLFASKIIGRETYKELKETYKSKGLLSAVGEFFNKKRADVNILTSTIGLLTSVAIGSFPPLEKIGRTLRDLIGFHADYAVGIKAFSTDPETGKPTGAGNKEYGIAGLLYALAGAFDIGDVWLPFENLHFASLGIDRFSSRKMVDAQNKGNT